MHIIFAFMWFFIFARMSPHYMSSARPSPSRTKLAVSTGYHGAQIICQGMVSYRQMEEKIFEERELVLELFPGTSPELWPPGEILYYRDQEARVHIEESPLHLILEPLEPTGSTTPIVCAACHRHVSRTAAQFFRFGVGQDARCFRYVALCRDTENCSGIAPPARLREILLRGILP